MGDDNGLNARESQLLYLVSLNNIDRVKALLDSGVDPSSSDYDRRTGKLGTHMVLFISELSYSGPYCCK